MSKYQRTAMEKVVQQELANIYSSAFDNTDTERLKSMKTAIKLLKVHTSPQIYKMVIQLFHDYNPCQGEQHRNKTVKYISILLSNYPDLGDFVCSLVPQADYGYLIQKEHQLIVDGLKRKNESPPPLHPKKSQVKFYNYISPTKHTTCTITRPTDTVTDGKQGDVITDDINNDETNCVPFLPLLQTSATTTPNTTIASTVSVFTKSNNETSQATTSSSTTAVRVVTPGSDADRKHGSKPRPETPKPQPLKLTLSPASLAKIRPYIISRNSSNSGVHSTTHMAQRSPRVIVCYSKQKKYKARVECDTEPPNKIANDKSANDQAVGDNNTEGVSSTGIRARVLINDSNYRVFRRTLKYDDENNNTLKNYSTSSSILTDIGVQLAKSASNIDRNNENSIDMSEENSSQNSSSVEKEVNGMMNRTVIRNQNVPVIVSADVSKRTSSIKPSLLIQAKQESNVEENTWNVAEANAGPGLTSNFNDTRSSQPINTLSSGSQNAVITQKNSNVNSIGLTPRTLRFDYIPCTTSSSANLRESNLNDTNVSNNTLGQANVSMRPVSSFDANRTNSQTSTALNDLSIGNDILSAVSLTANVQTSEESICNEKVLVAMDTVTEPPSVTSQTKLYTSTVRGSVTTLTSSSKVVCRRPKLSNTISCPELDALVESVLMTTSAKISAANTGPTCVLSTSVPPGSNDSVNVLPIGSNDSVNVLPISDSTKTTNFYATVPSTVRNVMESPISETCVSFCDQELETVNSAIGKFDNTSQVYVPCIESFLHKS